MSTVEELEKKLTMLTKLVCAQSTEIKLLKAKVDILISTDTTDRVLQFGSATDSVEDYAAFWSRECS